MTTSQLRTAMKCQLSKVAENLREFRQDVYDDLKSRRNFKALEAALGWGGIGGSLYYGLKHRGPMSHLVSFGGSALSAPLAVNGSLGAILREADVDNYRNGREGARTRFNKEYSL